MGHVIDTRLWSWLMCVVTFAELTAIQTLVSWYPRLFLSCFGPRRLSLFGSMASSALSIGGVTVKGPTAPSQPPEVVFKALAEAYELDAKVKDFLINSGVRTLAEFCSMFRNEDEVKTLGIDTITDLPQPLAPRMPSVSPW